MSAAVLQDSLAMAARKLVHQTRMARVAAKPVAAVLRRTVTPSLGGACVARGTTGPSVTAGVQKVLTVQTAKNPVNA